MSERLKWFVEKAFGSRVFPVVLVVMLLVVGVAFASVSVPDTVYPDLVPTADEPWIIEVPSFEWNYLINQFSNGTVFAVNGSNGDCFVRDSDFSVVFEAAVTGLGSGVVCIASGQYTMASALDIPDVVGDVHVVGVGLPDDEYTPSGGTEIVTAGYAVNGGGSNWKSYSFEGLCFTVSGDYAGSAVDFSKTVVYCDDVWWRVTGDSGGTALVFGGGGPPASPVVWSRVLFYDGRTSAEYQYLVQWWYEGFMLESSCVVLNTDNDQWLNLFNVEGNLHGTVEDFNVYESTGFTASSTLYQVMWMVDVDMTFRSCEFISAAKIQARSLDGDGTVSCDVWYSRYSEVGAVMVPTSDASVLVNYFNSTTGVFDQS